MFYWKYRNQGFVSIVWIPYILWWVAKRIFRISLQKTKYQLNTCILRVSKLWSFYRYPRISQVSMAFQNFWYGVICSHTNTAKRRSCRLKALVWVQMRSRLIKKIPIRLAIRITFSAPQERDAIHRECPLGHAFHDH